MLPGQSHKDSYQPISFNISIGLQKKVAQDSILGGLTVNSTVEPRDKVPI